MAEKKRLFDYHILPFIMIIVVMLMISGLFLYRDSLQSDLDAANGNTLSLVMEQQRFTFASKLWDQKNSIKTYADSLQNANLLNEEALLSKLNLITKNSTFDYVSYALPNGNTLENTGAHLNIADRAYFRAALNGETVITDPLESHTTGNRVVIFATPIITGGTITGVMVGVYDNTTLSNLLMPSFEGMGYTYITTGDGNLIASTKTNSSLAIYSNLFDAMDTVKYLGLDSNEILRANTYSGKSGHTQYEIDGESRLMYYSPIGINDWYIFSVVPDSVIAPHTIRIMYNTTLFMLAIATLSVLVWIYLFIARRRHIEELREIAFVDSLTGHANKRQFMLNAEEILKSTQSRFSFILLDIDKFKVLNDRLGYECGDALLISISKILQLHVGANECFGRCDSDEFYLLLTYESDCILNERIQSIIQDIRSSFQKNLDPSYSLVLCAGVYIITNVQESMNSISDKARHAHRLIKDRGESGISFYDEEIRNKILEEKEIEDHMQSALDQDEFLLFLQPKYYLHNEKIYGAEALVRWRNENTPLIFPNIFIPIFEKNGFITKLDMYMLEKACQIIRSWIDSDITPIPLSINFSRIHLKDPCFVDDIATMVTRYDIPPELIEVELTESTMLDNELVLIDVLEHLHSHGFTLSMDDFGSGYSSLGLLKNLPVDVIKLDRTFFADYSDLNRAIAVISGVVSIASKLDIETVAEGVETREQVEFLKKLGCDIVQGYYYARPMPLEDINLLLKAEAAAENQTKNNNE